MRLPQIVVYETDGWLAAQVSDLARENGWLVRESRQAAVQKKSAPTQQG